MAVAEFPFQSVSGSNPLPLFFEMQPERFVVGKTLYDDGGADYALQHGGTGHKTWIVKYDGLTAAQAAILDAHVASAFYSDDEGSAWGFNMRDIRTAVLYTNVHYAPGGYKIGHKKTWICSREIVLEKRP
jgi:hypothetical protein